MSTYISGIALAADTTDKSKASEEGPPLVSETLTSNCLNELTSVRNIVTVKPEHTEELL